MATWEGLASQNAVVDQAKSSGTGLIILKHAAYPWQTVPEGFRDVVHKDRRPERSPIRFSRLMLPHFDFLNRPVSAFAKAGDLS